MTPLKLLLLLKNKAFIETKERITSEARVAEATDGPANYGAWKIIWWEHVQLSCRNREWRTKEHLLVGRQCQNSTSSSFYCTSPPHNQVHHSLAVNLKCYPKSNQLRRETSITFTLQNISGSIMENSNK